MHLMYYMEGGKRVYTLKVGHAGQHFVRFYRSAIVCVGVVVRSRLKVMALVTS